MKQYSHDELEENTVKRSLKNLTPWVVVATVVLSVLGYDTS